MSIGSFPGVYCETYEAVVKYFKLVLLCLNFVHLSVGFGCLATRGTMVLFGGASGYPVSLDLALLTGSHSMVFPKLFDYIATPEELNERANDVFSWISQGKIKMDSFTVLALSEAKKAHDLLEGKKTTGKLLLKP